MTYETMRYFADTWGLLFMFLVFVAVLGWVLRPGSSKNTKKMLEYRFRRTNRP